MKFFLHIQEQSLIHLQPKVSAGVISYCCKLRIKRCCSTFSWTETRNYTQRKKCKLVLLMQWGFFCSGQPGFVAAITGVESIGKGLT